MKDITKVNVKKRRRLFALVVILIIIILFAWWFFKAKDYEIEYKIGDYQIIETYKKNIDAYQFLLIHDDKKYATIAYQDYSVRRKIIRDIKELKIDDTVCLTLESDYISFNPLCHNEEEQISFHLVSEDMKKQLDQKYFHEPEKVSFQDEKIKVNSLVNHIYYLYNYKGFYQVTNDGIKNISLFSKDIYDAPLITKVSKYLFIPDYESDYFFQKVYLLNLETGEVKPWKLPETIYFDSMILGSYEDELYLLDKHERKEWKINVKKRKIEKVSKGDKGVTYQDGFIEKSINKIIVDNEFFKIDKGISYSYADGFYQNILDQKILFSKKKPKLFFSGYPDEVFYLVNEELFYYSDYYGEVKLMSNFEWNFNYQNMIFVY